VCTATYVSPTSITISPGVGTQTNVPFFTLLGNGVNIGPAHSITCVVEGGASSSIANAIYNNKGLGCYTQGSTSISVTDPNNGSLTSYINYYVLAYTPIFVSISVHPLNGFTSDTQSAIVNNVTAYLNSLGIGGAVLYSELYGAALLARSNPDNPEFSIKALYSGIVTGSTGTVDIPLAYNYAAKGNPGNVSVNIV
jgi:hypothetical protein